MARRHATAVIRRDRRRRWPSPWLGSGVGFVLSASVARLLFGADGTPPEGMPPGARWATINALALLPAIGATIGFNSTRRIAVPLSAQ